MGERLAGDGVENPKSTGVPSTEAECWGFPPRPQLGIWGQLEMARIGLGAELEGWVPGRFNLPPKTTTTTNYRSSFYVGGDKPPPHPPGWS